MSVKIAEPCATRIKKALSIRNMTQTELCARAKISKSTLSEYLSGKYEPKQDKVFILAQALGVDPVWLWGYDVPMETQIEISPDKMELTEGERMMLGVFRLIPEEQQRAFLEMGRAYANSLKKD
jgi:transcriptional regulator with XRE-family HTH domain